MFAPNMLSANHAYILVIGSRNTFDINLKKIHRLKVKVFPTMIDTMWHDKTGKYREMSKKYYIYYKLY